MKPSSSTEGFFQQTPLVENQYLDDEALQRVLGLFLPDSVRSKLAPSLASFGSLVLSPAILAQVADAERHPPELVPLSTFGKRRDELVTSAGWKALQNIGINSGVVAIAYERENGAYSRVHQFIVVHLWTASSAFVTCPSAMTDGAAKLLSVNGRDNAVFDAAFKHLISRNEKTAWTSGQWMTERAGGSDVAGTETAAVYEPDGHGNELGLWSISGFKWFSSATDGDMAILLAQTKNGLSAFYAPMYVDRSKGQLNGVQIQRLKNKMGSKALPTAELELKNMRAHLIGKEGSGVREIATILNITRIHTAVGAVGFWGRGLSIARAFAKVRAVRASQKLTDNRAHVATLADQLIEYKAWMLTTFFVVSLLGREECPTDEQKHHVSGLLPVDGENVSNLLRLLTPVIKAQASKAAIHGLQECMEALGGVGYLENEDPGLNIARIFRDCNVLSIWEGTTNIMADDLVRVAKGRNGVSVLATFDKWLESGLSVAMKSTTLAESRTVVVQAYDNWKLEIKNHSADNLRANGREVIQRLGWIVCSALLIIDALRTPSDDVATEVAARWVSRGHESKRNEMSSEAIDTKFKIDRRLVMGPEGSLPQHLPSNL